MAELGNLNKCYIGTTTGGSTTWTLLAGESTNSVNLSSNAVETSDKSSAWQKFIAGMRGGTADVTVYADNSDVQQKAVLTAFKAGTEVMVFIGQLETAAPSKGIAFSALVNSISDTNDNGSASSRSLSLQITGEPTFYPTA